MNAQAADHPSQQARSGRRTFSAKEIAHYYDGKLTAFGATPLGVDWSCEPTQQLRFIQLLKVCDLSRPISLNDLGCGYGALPAFLKERHRKCRIDYLGVDISQAMVSQARMLWKGHDSFCFELGERLPRKADYSVASGVFNVKLDHGQAAWKAFVAQALANLDESSRLGFAVNFLKVVPGQARIPQLYRTHPQPWLDYCVARFKGTTRVLDNYGMTEFTLMVTR